MIDQAQMLKDYIALYKKEDVKKINKKPGNGTKIITVTSGKGGVGKTNFTVNFAIELSKKGNKVLIIDADFGLSNVDVILGTSPRYDLSHVINRQKGILDIISEGPSGIKYVSGGSGVHDLISLNKRDLIYFLNELQKLESIAAIIIFDSSAGINEKTIQLIKASDETILITTPEPTAIIDAYALVKTVFRYDKNIKIKLLVNKANSAMEANKIISNFTNVAKRYINAELENLGYILDDNCISKAVKMQKPFVISYPRSAASKSIMNIAAAYLNESKNSTGGELKSFFMKLFDK